MNISVLKTMILASIACSVGCAGLGKSTVDRSTGRGPAALKSMLSNDEPEFYAPSSMVAIWKPSTYEKPGTKSIRGFGGRFYFHNARNEPVKVDGTLTIYGYDDAEGETSGRADRKFVFESGTFQQHHSASGLGDSYSFWVPWDEVGGFEKTITLIPVFRSADGKIPESQPSTLRLPGKKREVIATASDSLYGPGTQVISASGIVSEKPMVRHAVAITGDGDDQSVSLKPLGRRKATTFKVPPNLVQRMAGTTPKEPSLNEVDRPSESSLDEGIETEIGKTNAVIDRNEIETPKQRPVFGQPGSF